jgi:threonine dehydrogenase-like Zn-dependent dehydrogenase
MKAAVYYGPHDIRIEDVAEPKLEPYGIIIQVKACGVCGSDLHPYTSWDLMPKIKVGLTMGHEFTGEVVQVGPKAIGIKKGDRVAAYAMAACGKCEWCHKYMPERCTNVQIIGVYVNGAFAERVSVPMAMAYRTVFPLPSHISYETAAILDPLAVGVHGAQRAQPSPGDTVVIQGSGPIGLCTLQSFKLMGINDIIVSEKSKKRLAMAKAMGATVIDANSEDPVRRVYELTGGKGADIVAETAAAPPTMRMAIDMARFGGKVIIFTLNALANPRWDVDDIFIKHLTLIGTQGGGLLEPLELISSGKVDVDSLITHRFSLEKTKDAFETALKVDEAIKVMVNM